MRDDLLCGNDFGRMKEGENLRETGKFNGWRSYRHPPGKENPIDYRFAADRSFSLVLMGVSAAVIVMGCMPRMVVAMGMGMSMRVLGR